MTTSESQAPLAQRLREAITERGVSQRQLARDLAGPGADDRRVENERRQIAKYLAGQHVPTAQRARSLARLLGKPDDYFVEPEEARSRLVDQIRGMAATIDVLMGLVEERLPAPDGAGEELRALAAGIRDLTDGQAAVLQELRELRSDLAAARQTPLARPRRKRA